MKTRELTLAALRPAPWNANRVAPATMRKIRRSIERFGIVENLVARPHPTETDAFEVISGNHRLEILADMGFAKATVHVVDVDDAHARILAETLNNSRGRNDPEAYAKLLEEALAGVGSEEALRYLNETEASLERALQNLPGRNLRDLDDAPEPPAKAESEPGEVYELGDHRLICGDSTDPKVWKKLLGRATAQLLLTDPPYGVDYGAKTRSLKERHGKALGNGNGGGGQARRDIAGDGVDAKQLAELLRGALGAAREHVVGGGAFYVFHSDAHVETFRAAARSSGWKIHQTLIWVKDQLVLGRLDYHAAHELILYGWNPGAAHRWYGTRRESSVLDSRGRSSLSRNQLAEIQDAQQASIDADVIVEPRPRRSKLHPTMKPVALLERLLLNSSDRGDIVLDPFGGSGSTLIACEKRGRRCVTIELEPTYCDVIRRRYETAVFEPAAA